MIKFISYIFLLSFICYSKDVVLFDAKIIKIPFINDSIGGIPTCFPLESVPDEESVDAIYIDDEHNIYIKNYYYIKKKNLSQDITLFVKFNFEGKEAYRKKLNIKLYGPFKVYNNIIYAIDDNGRNGATLYKIDENSGKMLSANLLIQNNFDRCYFFDSLIIVPCYSKLNIKYTHLLIFGLDGKIRDTIKENYSFSGVKLYNLFADNNKRFLGKIKTYLISNVYNADKDEYVFYIENLDGKLIKSFSIPIYFLGKELYGTYYGSSYDFWKLTSKDICFLGRKDKFAQITIIPIKNILGRK